MEDEKKSVEESTGTADAGGVEQEDSHAPESDPEAEVIALQAKLAKAESDRDNYRSGLLAMKGKKDVDDLDLSDPTQLQAYIEKTVQEKLAHTDTEQARKAFEATAIANAKKVKELQRALNSKNASTSISGGSSSGAGNNSKSEVSTSYWSPEQVEALRKRGWDDKKIAQAGELARTNAATAPRMR